MAVVVCIVPVSPMRREAAHRSEMVSQLLFGECANILEDEGDFIKVRGAYDSYEGWCQRSQLKAIDDSVPPATTLFSSGFHDEVLLQGEPMSIPFGCPLYSAEQSAILFGEGLVDNKDLLPNAIQSSLGFTPERVRDISIRFLNTSYLWGGRSVFGIDCSGFSQQVFKLMGISLLRDAYQQAERGEAVPDLSSARIGDLVFFNNEAGRITHVGILLKPNEIIHASGRVRIDRITGEGIYNEQDKKTHNLHSIRRMHA
ncbi:MAG TPA: C40 family peptidase [Flavisolibacter sp.]